MSPTHGLYTVAALLFPPPPSPSSQQLWCVYSSSLPLSCLAREGAELYGKVLKVNAARPMKHKLGAHTAVWSADDWYKNTLVEGDDTAKMAADELEPAEPLQPVATN
ncbi:unnamed protein product [Sphacelaria rigidula]